MNSISSLIVKRRGIFLVLFCALMVFSIFSMSWVNVENDISVYLSEDMESKKGALLMEQEFVTYATVDVMVENITEEDAQEIQQMLQGLDGVLSVTYDNSADHYKDDAALFNVSFDGTAQDEDIIKSYAELKQSLSGYTASIYSESFVDYSEALNDQITGVIIIVVIAVIAVLLLTSSNYAEVLVLLLTFTAAALINMGTHFLLGTISFVSNSVAIVMQLALSLDYAIILCNRYKEEHLTKPIVEAAKSSLALAIPEIFSSSLTTVAGLVAMTLMQFRLGMDLGLALIKAIIISLLSVFLLMPALLVIFGKLMDKTIHKPFLPKINFVGRFAYAARYIIPPLFVALVIFSFVSFNKVTYAYSMEIIDSFCVSDVDAARNRIYEKFGKNHMLPVMVPAGDYEKEAALIADLQACDEVNSVLGLASIEAINGFSLTDEVNYLDFMQIANVDSNTAQAIFAYYAADNDGYHNVPDDLRTYKVCLMDLFLMVHEVAQTGAIDLPQEQIDQIDSLYGQLKMAQDQLQGNNYSRIIVYMDLPEQSQETFDFLSHVHVLADKYYDDDDVYITGMSVAARDFNQTFTNDSNIVGILSLVFVLVILFFTFKSVALPLLLILVIQGSIWINFSIPVVMDSYVYFMWYLIVSSIQMGANIDYAIVISSRYTSLRRQHVSKKAAIIDSLNFAFPTVMSSGTLMVIAGLFIYLRVSDVVICGIGRFISLGTLITLILVLFVLPSMLILGDTIIQKTTLTVAAKLHFKNPSKAARRAASFALAATAIATLVLMPLSKIKVSRQVSDTLAQCQQQLTSIKNLEDLCEEFNLSQEAYDKAKLSFAEGYVTEKVGSDELAKGQQQYDEGKAKLDASEAQYADSYSQYEAGLAEYESNKALLDAGQSEYDTNYAKYQAALKEYKAGLKQYNDGLAQYNQGKADYEAGLKQYNQGKADYEAGLKQYNESKATFDTVNSLYKAAQPLYMVYLDAEQRYEAAVASGNRILAAALMGEVTAGKIAFETKLGSYGSFAELEESFSAAQADLDDAKAQLDEGKRELSDAEAQLNEAKATLTSSEAQLNDAKKQLDDGKKQLDDAKAQLDAGQKKLNSGKAQLSDGKEQLTDAKSQLDDARDQLDDGQSQLSDAKKQLDDGKKQLTDNNQKLLGSLDELDKYSSDQEKLTNGIDLLLSVDGIEAAVSKDSSYLDICHAAENYYTSLMHQVNAQSNSSFWSTLFIIIAAVLSLLSAVFGIMGKFRRPTSLACMAAVILCGIGLVLWNLNFAGYTVLLVVGAAMCLMAVLCMDQMAKLLRLSRIADTSDGPEDSWIPSASQIPEAASPVSEPDDDDQDTFDFFM